MNNDEMYYDTMQEENELDVENITEEELDSSEESMEEIEEIEEETDEETEEEAEASEETYEETEEEAEASEETYEETEEEAEASDETYEETGEEEGAEALEETDEEAGKAEEDSELYEAPEAVEEAELEEAMGEAVLEAIVKEVETEAGKMADKKSKKKNKNRKKAEKKAVKKAIGRAVGLVEKAAIKEAGSKAEKKAIKKALAKADKKAVRAAVKEALMEEAAAVAEKKAREEAAAMAERKAREEAAAIAERKALLEEMAMDEQEALMEAEATSDAPEDLTQEAANADQEALKEKAKDDADKAEAKAKKKRSKPDPIKAEIKALRSRLVAMQQIVREQGIPIIVLVEGWSAAGKGSLINELISEIDPRNYNVVSPVITPEAKSRYPFLYPYANAIPENGKIMFYDSGWMEDCVRKVLSREITRDEYKNRIRAVTEFERQLRDGGYLILKLFLNISEAEQRERIFSLRENFETEWRVTPEDMWQLKEHRTFWQNYRIFMDKTSDPIPWHVLDGKKRTLATRDALALLMEQIDKALKKGRYVGKPFKEKFPLLTMPKLSEVDLSPALSDEEYKKELKKLQKRLGELHNVLYRKKIPVILCYEGWDAAGKGGNIRRVARPLDPRGCDVIPIASPEPHEKNRQYLWRFWTRLPRTGHVCIFDRTWYGRVMVERLEGFCEEDDWKRAYNEINEFERQLTDWGAVVIKFWIHIDQDTQLERFTARQNTPEKAWKLTEEDWRNREKWPVYEEAIDEMLQKTSTQNAPWVIIESNDKKYARIKALRIVVEALEKACAERLA